MTTFSYTYKAPSTPSENEKDTTLYLTDLSDETDVTKQTNKSFVLLTAQSSSSICDFHRELVGTIHDFFTFTSRNVVSDFSSVCSFQHQKEFHVFDVVNDKFSESIGHHVSGLCVAPVTDAGHKILSLESSSYSAVNTLWFSPAWSNFVESFRLVTDEPFGSFLDDHSFCAGDNHCGSSLENLLENCLAKNQSSQNPGHLEFPLDQNNIVGSIFSTQDGILWTLLKF